LVGKDFDSEISCWQACPLLSESRPRRYSIVRLAGSGGLC
jgi:hypothetical protein